MFKTKKARFRLQYRYMYMDEFGPVIGIDWRPMNLKAVVQKWNYVLMKYISYYVSTAIMIEAFKDETPEINHQHLPLKFRRVWDWEVNQQQTLK